MKKTFALIFCILLAMLFFIACSNTPQNVEQTEQPEQTEQEIETEPTSSPSPSPTQNSQIEEEKEDEDTTEQDVEDNDISWEEFVALYDGDMPDFASLSTFTLCETFPETQGGYRIGAYFKEIELGDFDRFIDFAIENGYENTLSIRSEYIMDDTKYPLLIENFASESGNNYFQIIHMKQGIEQIVIEYLTHEDEIE